ncbi:hypothetical protein SAMN05216228_104123 [Rhizobium tibeticum]|uniref:Uncharacterized protein n=1 Tax=Rhizobium tibeticum TaxID=501024 RepID=A0A1H8VC72_9HYPH|nr:hypothetical protein [Rhizobium tibeticum]SEI18738.1 hypothetical protein RTCCBAU85039_5987 [Rhizobium tibeticum]SEP13009.1 hypothetical protein SAMN05216228_104123 [Rhizobium tibeticum]
MSHDDLRLLDRATFEAEEVADLVSMGTDRVNATLAVVSLEPGKLVEVPDGHLFLGDAIRDTPSVRLGDSFVFTIPQTFCSHVHRIMDRLASEAGLKEALEKARADYLERKLDITLRRPC